MKQVIINQILKEAQVNVSDSPDATKPGEETQIDYEQLPIAVQNTITKIRLRPAHFKRVTKQTNRGLSTYKLYFKQTQSIKLAKQYLKTLFSDRAFIDLTFASKELILSFNFMER